MKLNRLLALVLSGSLTLSVTMGNAPFAFAASADSNETSTSQTNVVEVEQLDGSDYDLDLTRDDAVTQDNLDDTISPDEDVRVIIVMDGDSVVSANSAAVYSNDTAAQMEEIKAAQDKVIADIEETALDGDDLTVSYQYSWLVNGVAATVPYGKMSDIESVDGVDKVVMQTVYEPCSTDETPSSNIVYPRTISDGQMIGREDTWAQGYKGEGMKIAIIDTGLDTDHQNFAALPDEVLTDTSLTQADIDGVLTSLNAYERYSGLTSADLYYNTKVAYGFNYVDNSLDITHDNDTEGDHGTHVAGIAAANKVDESEVVGVAPNAQLMVMKVFGTNGGAYTEDWVAGMEDAMMLGADVINMSQGSGLADAYGAVTTQAYLTVDGCDVPKVVLYDDPDQAGSYNYFFNVTNFGDATLFYDLNTVAQTEGVNSDYADQGYLFMSHSPMALAASTGESTSAMAPKFDATDSGVCDSHDAYWIYRSAVAGAAMDENWTDAEFRYNTNGDDVVNNADVQSYLNALVGLDSDTDLAAQVMAVAPGATETVNVNVTLADSDRTYFADNYPNGGYVEGLTFLTALNANGTDLSLPYLGFYGDWTDAPIFDGDNDNPDTHGFYWGDDSIMDYSQYISVLWPNFGGQTSGWVPGLNPYVEETFDLSHVSLSPNGDGNGDYVDDMYISLLRNAATLTFTFTYTDTNTGEEYFSETVDHVQKSNYVANYGMCVPYVYSWYGTPYQLTDAEGNTLPNNTNVTLTISATLDYPNSPVEEKSVSFPVDTTAPELLGTELTQEDGKSLLTLTFSDNLSVTPAPWYCDTQLTWTTSDANVAVVNEGTVTATGVGTATITVTDTLTGVTGTATINVVAPDRQINGFVIASMGDDGLASQWTTFNASNPADYQTLNETQALDYMCAEYVGGTLYAVDFDGNLCTMDKRSGEITVIGDTGVDPYGYQSLAFDFDTDCLYWAYSNVYSDMWAGIQNRDTAVYVVDTTDASVVKVGDTGCMLSGLYFPTDNEPQVPDTVKADSLVVTPTSLLLNKGETAQLSALVLPVSVSQLEGMSEVTFTSDNEAVATVDSEGNITAVGLGVAQITVSAGDLSVTCSVSVVDDTVQMYAFNQSGWETTKLLDPSETLEEAVSDTLGQAYPVSRDIDKPVSIAFNSADTFYVYDTFMDYIYLSTLDGTTVTSVLWAQPSMNADADTFSMVYSQTYQRLFIMTVDTYYGTGEQTLYMVDPLSGTITHLGDGAWTKNVVDLLLVEGAAPSPAPTAEVE